MKNTDPPGSNHKGLKLSSERARFIESMGLYFERMGISRIGGRILGLLMISPKPLSAEELAHTLKVSRGSISTNMRALMASGMIERAVLLHERTTYYAYSEAALEQRILTGIQGTLVFRRVAEQGLNILPEGDPARGRIERSIEWSDLLVEAFHNTIRDWREKHPDLPRQPLKVEGV
jgi:hypothetical protein